MSQFHADAIAAHENIVEAMRNGNLATANINWQNVIQLILKGEKAFCRLVPLLATFGVPATTVAAIEAACALVNGPPGTATANTCANCGK